jgi:DNA-binding CsgD family transcriptional regulator
MAMYSNNLTPKELRVLKLIGQGKSNKEIAAIEHNSEEVIKNHNAHIFYKLEANNRVHAALIGISLGLVETPFTEITRKILLAHLSEAEAKVTELKLALLKLDNKEPSSNAVSVFAGQASNEN